MKAIYILIVLPIFISTVSNALQTIVQSKTNPKRLVRVDRSEAKVLNSAPYKTEALGQLLGEVAAYDMNRLKVKQSVVKDSVCGDAYFVDIIVHGFRNFVQARIDFYAQTYTKAQMDRLYNAIQKNYPTKGLPACMLNSQYYPHLLTVYTYHYDPDMTTVLLPAKNQIVPAPYECAGRIERPVTDCWNVKDPYAPK